MKLIINGRNKHQINNHTYVNFQCNMSLKVKQISIVEHDGRKYDIQSSPEDANVATIQRRVPCSAK